MEGASHLNARRARDIRRRRLRPSFASNHDCAFKVNSPLPGQAHSSESPGGRCASSGHPTYLLPKPTVQSQHHAKRAPRLVWHQCPIQFALRGAGAGAVCPGEINEEGARRQRRAARGRHSPGQASPTPSWTGQRRAATTGRAPSEPFSKGEGAIPPCGSRPGPTLAPSSERAKPRRPCVWPARRRPARWRRAPGSSPR
jgi:hypothetical protein